MRIAQFNGLLSLNRELNFPSRADLKMLIHECDTHSV